MNIKAILIGVAIVSVGMAISNPNKNSYVEYAADEVARTGKNTFCTDVPIAAQQQCKIAIALLSSQGKPLIKKFIDSSTNQQNFILFSLYTTDFPNQKLTTIAAFGNFHMFQ